MHRIIIPVDFSETSLNAARYASKMLAWNESATAVLYHNYENEDDLDISLYYLESLKKEFNKAGVRQVECEHELGGDLIENISRLAHTMRATLVMMGITGKSAIRQVMFGSNTLKLIDKNLYPVMIIPPDAVYKGVTKVAFATDYQHVELSTPSQLIGSVLKLLDPKLHIVHVSKEAIKTLPAALQLEKEKVDQMFADFKKEFFFITNEDFYEALDSFVKEQDIDILVTVPKHPSNSSSLFRTSHTKKLAYHSHIPILAAHQ
ncbi:MAG TPA: universal stress protein [Chitinophagaceae bacterium]|nr:universal stress protein [Chitinophagaceae bacterium]HPH30781.1 universal stress protein [Chitinophagaceae bacterium]HPN58086.1 universal stress protein [Chitinophagaceae bacterium]